jgi:hypothetical protein
LSSTSRITSSPDLEPLICKEANWFVCWHNAIKSEIVALNENGILSLVPFDPTMNEVFGSYFAYSCLSFPQVSL